MHLRRVLPLVAAVTVAGLVTFGCAEQSAGVRVGNETVSESEMAKELDAFGQNEALFTGAGQSTEALRGDLGESYSQEFVSEIVQQRITFMLAAQIFEDEGLTLSDADRQAAASGLSQQMGAGLEAFPADYRDTFITDVAKYNALIDHLGDSDFRMALVRKAGSTDIQISSRFGRWDEKQLRVEPPAAPARRSGTSDTTAPTGATGAPVG